MNDKLTQAFGMELFYPTCSDVNIDFQYTEQFFFFSCEILEQLEI